MGWEDDAKKLAETVKARKAARTATRHADRAQLELVVDTAIGGAMTKAIATLNKFADLFGGRFIPTRSFKGDPANVKEYGIKDKDDMNRRVDVIRVARERLEIRVDNVKYECDIIYNVDAKRLTLDPWPTRFPNDGRVLHPRHAEELGQGRAFDTGLYLGAVAVEWAKKHKYSRLD